MPLLTAIALTVKYPPMRKSPAAMKVAYLKAAAGSLDSRYFIAPMPKTLATSPAMVSTMGRAMREAELPSSATSLPARAVAPMAMVATIAPT